MFSPTSTSNWTHGGIGTFQKSNGDYRALQATGTTLVVVIFDYNNSTITSLPKTDITNDNASCAIEESEDVSLEEAKKRIALYFREHDGCEIGYEELIENLRIDPLTVVEACAELEQEGKIG